MVQGIGTGEKSGAQPLLKRLSRQLIPGWRGCMRGHRDPFSPVQMNRRRAISQRRACVLVGVDPKTVGRARPEIRKAMQEIASVRRRFGYRRIGPPPERRGRLMNPKKLYRPYREEGLPVRRRCGRKQAHGTCRPMPLALMPNQRWSLDFLADRFGASRKFARPWA